MPVMQSAVADATSLADRPKYIGRLSATFGMGFVLGPALSVLFSNLLPAEKIRIAAGLPLLGFLVILLFAEETKRNLKSEVLLSRTTKSKAFEKLSNDVPLSVSIENKALSKDVLLVVMNGFLIMCALGTETVYAMFIKDTFGYEEFVLSGLFAVNGLFIGAFQVFLVNPLVESIGPYGTLALGNLLLGVGMLGLALIRSKVCHFFLFSCHLLGYSIADTAVVSLISHYSASSSLGRDLSLNQASQSCARTFSPLIAGLLYEHSKRESLCGENWFPVGALPFIAGGVCSLCALIVPALLSTRVA